MNDNTSASGRSRNGHTPEPVASAPWTTATPSWLHTSATLLQAALIGAGQGLIGPAATLWPIGQDSDAAQRTGPYRPRTLRHRQRTLPARVSQAVDRYSCSGQTVFGPFVGVDATVVEAVHADRRASDVDIDPRGAEPAKLNLGYPRRLGAAAQWTAHWAARAPMICAAPHPTHTEVDHG